MEVSKFKKKTNLIPYRSSVLFLIRIKLYLLTKSIKPIYGYLSLARYQVRFNEFTYVSTVKKDRNKITSLYNQMNHLNEWCFLTRNYHSMSFIWRPVNQIFRFLSELLISNNMCCLTLIIAKWLTLVCDNFFFFILEIKTRNSFNRWENFSRLIFQLKTKHEEGR